MWSAVSRERIRMTCGPFLPLLSTNERASSHPDWPRGKKHQAALNYTGVSVLTLDTRWSEQSSKQVPFCCKDKLNLTINSQINILCINSKLLFGRNLCSLHKTSKIKIILVLYNLLFSRSLFVPKCLRQVRQKFILCMKSYPGWCLT